MTPEQRLQFDPEDLDEMAAVSPEDRQKPWPDASAAPGSCGTASSILIDQLFPTWER